MQPLQVKVIYHPTDESAQLELRKHLAPLMSGGIMQLIENEEEDDPFGDDDEVVMLPDLVFLLMSSELLADNERINNELMPAFQDSKTHVLPILVKDCDYTYARFFREHIKKDRRVYPRKVGDPKPVAINNAYWGNSDTAITHILSSESSKGKGHNLAKQIEKLYQKGARPQTGERPASNNITQQPAVSKTNPPAQTPSALEKILFMTANPNDTQSIGVMREYKSVEQMKQLMDRQNKFELKLVPNTTSNEFMQRILGENPKVLHFSGHGTGQAGLIFHDENDNAQFASTDALSAVFSLFAGKIDCVIFNACYSQEQAKVIAQYVPYVIGTSKAIDDSKAMTFASGFYSARFSGMPYEQAFMAGKAQILMAGLPEGAEIILYKEGTATV